MSLLKLSFRSLLNYAVFVDLQKVQFDTFLKHIYTFKILSRSKLQHQKRLACVKENANYMYEVMRICDDNSMPFEKKSICFHTWLLPLWSVKSEVRMFVIGLMLRGENENLGVICRTSREM